MNTSVTVGSATQPTPAELGRVDALYKKVGWRLLPILLISYMIAYLDRVNIGYAQLGMKQTLPWSNEVYALGAGMFFVGYLIFEVPSNLMLTKIGARKTMLRIMVLWGICAAGMMYVTTPTQFYIVRFILGACEAGFFPGVILYFTYWYPSIRRGQVIAIFMSATMLISVVAGPISGATLKYMDGWNGWHGWQWLFLTQGVPAAILGVLVFLWLDDKPAQAKWLSASEKNLLHYNLEMDVDTGTNGGHSFGQVMRDPKVYVFALSYFLLLGCAYTIIFWTPTLIQSWGVKDVLMVGLLAAIPNAIAVVGMVFIGRNSDRTGERRMHYMVCTLLAAIGLGLTTVTTGNLVGSLAALSVAMIGMAGATPLFWTAVSSYLPKSSAAGGIAFISSLGAFGPAVSPSINAAITKATGSGTASMYVVMVAYLVCGALLVLVVGAQKKSPAIK
ncbi:MFS transporter [Variovorax sp. J22R133]|uniref:MFS transporter n=1 Tax=Variovorax brevis TaxID=3053503 RepID=UPI0025755577|nr:MFS transporter [Variovorax sp. J22R133]MDM0112898.1 MFS transporter [Variovorax sp. J22R133]